MSDDRNRITCERIKNGGGKGRKVIVGKGVLSARLSIPSIQPRSLSGCWPIEEQATLLLCDLSPQFSAQKIPLVCAKSFDVHDIVPEWLVCATPSQGLSIARECEWCTASTGLPTTWAVLCAAFMEAYAQASVYEISSTSLG